MIIINYLTKIRNERQLTQEQLAEKSGFSRQYIGLLETGVRGKKLPVPTAQRLADAMGVDWKEFYEDKKPPAPNEQT